MIEAIAVAGLVAAFAIWALVAERGRGNANTRVAHLEEQNKVLVDKCAERAAALINEKERGDGLAAAVAKFAAEAVGPVHGSFTELQQAVADFGRRADRSPVVRDAEPASPSRPDEDPPRGDDNLLKPGE